MASRALKDEHQQERAASQALAFLQELLREYHPRDFAIELWDGTSWEPEPGQFRRLTWRIRHPGAPRAAFGVPSQLAFAEAYIYGDFDLDGDLETVFPLAEFFLNKNWSLKQKVHLKNLLACLPDSSESRPTRPGPRLHGRVHSKERDRDVMRYHYDLSNEFYRLWLGQEMVYSCAYFENPEDDLDTAQRQKLDYVCRKLRLRAGERLLDIGCGWGALLIHAAREYGANAVGITLSREQARLAEERIQREDLGGRCQVKLLDYRDLIETEAFDKIVSIGMVEHVGEANLAEYFRRAYQALRPGGVFLNHGIGVPEWRAAKHGPTFTDVYVFPDGELFPISTVMRTAEHEGFEVRDVENLRDHYALTLRHWLRGLEDHCDEARRLVDEVTYRIWRLYAAGSAYFFQSGKLELYQTLLEKSVKGKSGMPLTRRDWY